MFGAVSRQGDEPSEHLARIVSMLLVLMREGFISYDWYLRSFERSARQFARDLRHLRQIGDRLDVRISHQVEGRARLISIAGKNRLKDSDGAPDHRAMIRTIARALGAPVARQLGITDDASEDRSGFLTFALPTLTAGSSVATVLDALSAAHVKNARVRFHYRSGKTRTTREVEPYRVLVRSGRYYLIGFDVTPRKGWRYFALDQITGPVSRAGTFKPRMLPVTYENSDTVGMLQGGPAIEVTIRLSSVVAASATSRLWQKTQRVRQHSDGSADITFTVNDAGEAIRWALGFGAEAEVIAPPAAVEQAREIATRLQRRYTRASTRALAG
jgi:proteasome accessory factor B